MEMKQKKKKISPVVQFEQWNSTEHQAEIPLTVILFQLLILQIHVCITFVIIYKEGAF